MFLGVPWTEEEHRLFLIGLQKLGKGDWRGIARNFVVSRTPTQVASHAQKYFIRQSHATRRKRRSSLFDMVPDMVGLHSSYLIGQSCSHPYFYMLSNNIKKEIGVILACTSAPIYKQFKSFLLFTSHFKFLFDYMSFWFVLLEYHDKMTP